MKNTRFSIKHILLSFILLTIGSCSTLDNEPEIPDERQELLEVMDYTAQIVSQVVASNDARQEIFGYAFEENAGEVEASFSELLSESPSQRSLINNAKTGSFSKLFRPKAENYNLEEKNYDKSSSINSVRSYLEDYLIENSLALYGPYLAENHSNSTRPITVSFDPLDDSKSTNYGYIFVPKGSSRSQANNGKIYRPNSNSTDEFELVLVEDIDDTYVQENPTLVIVPQIDTGNGSGAYSTPISSETNTQPLPIPTSGIDCDDLRSGDILRPFMQKFRLTDNLRSGFWNRNILNMYAITKDDVSFDINNAAVINTSTSKYWDKVRVSRADANKNNQKWITVNQRLDSNWLLDEKNLTIAVSYKQTSVTVDKITIGVTGVFSSSQSGSVSATLNFETSQNLLFSESYDKCATLALFNSPSLAGQKDGLAIEKFGKMEFTMDMDWRR